MSNRVQRPSLDIAVEIETTSGVIHRLDANTLNPDDRPTGIGFQTSRGNGFADGSFTLKRNVLRDYPDLSLVDTVRFIGGQGQVYYEGCVAGLARETGDGHSLSIPLAGWMSHAKDRRFKEVYIDRDLAHWQGNPSVARQINLTTGGTKYKLSAGEIAVDPDEAGEPSVRIGFSRIAKSGSVYPLAETWYAHDIPVGYVTATDYADKDQAGTALVAANFSILIIISSDDVVSALDYSSDLTGTSSAVTVTATDAKNYALLQMQYNGADTASDGEWRAYFKNLYVRGTHGLTMVGDGYVASDVITDIATRFCPLLDTSGIQATTYPITHIAYTEATYPYDAFLELNKAHLWELSVWEGRKLYFEQPKTLDEYDWQVRTDDPGVKLSFGGDSLAELGNGVEVQFTDLLTSESKVITPDDYPDDLADTTPDNPLNLSGRQKWLTYDIPFPCLEADAVQYGRAYFAEATRAKSPVSISCGYHIRDRGGNWRPAAEVRCGDRVAIVDHPNDNPRRIIDTNYSHEGKGLTISADRASQRLSAVVDRISAARTAGGL